MVKQMENVCDRELFSELFDNPINPSLPHVVPPFFNQNDPMHYTQLNGEVAFKWREVYHYPRTAFQLLQQSIAPLWYHEQWLPISHLFSNYALSLIDAKNVRPIVAHNAGSGDRRCFKALIISLRWSTAFFHVFTDRIVGNWIKTELFILFSATAKDCRRIGKHQWLSSS